MPMLDHSIALLNQNHDRNQFDCGEMALNNYLKELAGQHAKNHISKTFVITAQTDTTKVLGYYSLSAGSVTFEHLPTKWQKKLPRYPIPIARLARLAVDKSLQKKGFGQHLLMDALYRCVTLSTEIGIAGMIVDAKHETAKNFYERYGFTELTTSPLTLFIPMKNMMLASS
jgi:GNAT superfamily N-acetyltransferase